MGKGESEREERERQREKREVKREEESFPHLFVSVERVNDKLHHPVDLGLESKLLCLVS